MVVASLDEAKVLLYGEELDAFVAARDTLVKELRRAKERDLASDVKALRKPSAVAAEVNRVARADPDGVEVLLQAAELLRSAQAGLLDEAVLNFSDLQTQYRAAVKALAQTAASRKPEVRAALEAATIDVDSNDALRTGSLVVVPEPVSIFGVAAVSASEPTDELAVRRAKREQAAADKEAAAAAKKAARSDREIADAQATKLAKEAEAARAAKKQRSQMLTAHKKRLKDLTKQHRVALRSQLDALDDEAETTSLVEATAGLVDDLGDEIAALEEQIATMQQTLTELLDRKSVASDEHQSAVTAQKAASIATEGAHDAVQQLAAVIEQLETEIAMLTD